MVLLLILVRERGLESYRFGLGRMIFFLTSKYRRPFQVQCDCLRKKPDKGLTVFVKVRERGLEHYMFSTPCGYFVSLTHKDISQGFQVLGDYSQKTPGTRPGIFYESARERT